MYFAPPSFCTQHHGSLVAQSQESKCTSLHSPFKQLLSAVIALTCNFCLFRPVHLCKEDSVGLHLDAIYQLGVEAGRINYDIALWAPNEVACTSVAQLCMRAALTHQLQLYSRVQRFLKSVNGNTLTRDCASKCAF